MGVAGPPSLPAAPERLRSTAAAGLGAASGDARACSGGGAGVAAHRRATVGDLRRALATTGFHDQRLTRALLAKAPSQALRDAWAAWPHADDNEVVTTLRCYTDGSATLTRGTATSGFGFALLIERRLPTGTSLAFLGVGYAPVVINAAEAGHVGAMHHSAPVAELSSVLGVLCGLGSFDFQLPKFVFFIDCTYAINVLMGRSRACRNAALVHRVRQAMYDVTARTTVLAFHVKGHSGDPGNELADIAADAGAAADAANAARLFCAPPMRAAAQRAPQLMLSDLIFWQEVLEASDPRRGGHHERQARDSQA